MAANRHTLYVALQGRQKNDYKSPVGA